MSTEVQEQPKSPQYLKDVARREELAKDGEQRTYFNPPGEPQDRPEQQDVNERPKGAEAIENNACIEIAKAVRLYHWRMFKMKCKTNVASANFHHMAVLVLTDVFDFETTAEEDDKARTIEPATAEEVNFFDKCVNNDV